MLSAYTITEGNLVVFDAVHMPFGVSTTFRFLFLAAQQHPGRVFVERREADMTLFLGFH